MIFAGVEGVQWGYVLDGIIISIVFGFAIGNYACSLVFRLPRGRLILDQKPYCGSCGTALQVKDLFPVFSALWLRHRCRYCKTPYPVSHTWTEILVGALAVLAFFRFNFGDHYILVLMAGTFFITLAAIESNEGKVMPSILICTAACGLLFRTLEDDAISGALVSALAVLVGSCLWYRKQIKQVAHIYVPPTQVWVLTLGAGCAGEKSMLVYLLLVGWLYTLDGVLRKLRGNTNPALLTVSVGVAATLLMLYPEMGELVWWRKAFFAPRADVAAAL